MKGKSKVRLRTDLENHVLWPETKRNEEKEKLRQSCDTAPLSPWGERGWGRELLSVVTCHVIGIPRICMGFQRIISRGVK